MTNKTIYRMSAAGACPKRLSATRLGLEPEPAPPWLETAALEGKWHEERVKQELRNTGYAVFDEQKEVVIKQPTFHLVGHIDGILAGDPDGDKLLEVKSMSQFEFDRWMKDGFRGFPEYGDQLACYLLATGLKEALYIVKNRSSGYTDKRVIKYTANLYGGFLVSDRITIISNKIAKVEDYATRGELYPADFNSDSIECRRCEFKYLCLPKPKLINGTDEKILQMASERWREGKRLQARADELINSGKEILEAYAKEQPERKFVFDELLTNIIKTHKETYEKKALLQLFTPEQLAPALKITDYEYSSIKDLRKEEQDNG